VNSVKRTFLLWLAIGASVALCVRFAVTERRVSEANAVRAARVAEPRPLPVLLQPSDRSLLDRIDPAPGRVETVGQEMSPVRHEPVESEEVSLWEAEFGSASVRELNAAIEALDGQAFDAESIAAEEREGQGLFEIVAQIGKESPDRIVIYRVGPENVMHRVVLPPEEYPEIYRARRKLAWMKQELASR